jgi:hypothetical protein
MENLIQPDRHRTEVAQVAAADFLRMPAQAADAAPSSTRIWFDCSSDPASIEAWVRDYVRYPIVPPSDHVRFYNHDFSRFGLVFLHNVSETGDAELIVYASPGMVWTTTAVRGLAAWMFVQHDLRRVTARIRGDDDRTKNFARRLGFRHEGIQRRWFADDQDASLWGMLRSECKWLRRI